MIIIIVTSEPLLEHYLPHVHEVNGIYPPGKNDLTHRCIYTSAHDVNEPLNRNKYT